MITYYIYKIHFLCGFPTGRYYIGKHIHYGTLDTDKYAGSRNFCKAYYKKYGKILGETYLKEIIEINPSEDINSLREKELIGNLYISDPVTLKKSNYKGKRKVSQYTMNDEYITTYNSIKEAADATESKWQSIQRVCSGQRKSTNNYKWKYAD